MSIEFEGVSITPNPVDASQGFIMEVQISSISGMELAIISFSEFSPEWVDVSDGTFSLSVTLPSQSFPISTYEIDEQDRKRLIFNIDVVFEDVGDSTVITLYSYKKFNGVMGVLKK